MSQLGLETLHITNRPDDSDISANQVNGTSALAVNNNDNNNRNNDDDELLSDDDDLEFYSNLTRESFQYNLSKLPNTNEDFDASKFLIMNYKYWSLDDLIKSLKNLLSEIDNELIELVNNDYLNFIKLGKSIDGSIDLIHDCKIDLNNYIKELLMSNAKIQTDSKILDDLINYKKKLNLIKLIINYLILLDEQINTFNELVNNGGVDDLKELIVLFLSINKIFRKLIAFKDTKIEFLNILNKKIIGLKFEFNSLLSNHVIELKKDSVKNGDQILELLKIYNVLNEQNEFLKLYKQQVN